MDKQVFYFYPKHFDVIWCKFVDIWIFPRCKVIYFISQLGHMTKMQHPDWFVMCSCLHSHDAGHVLLLNLYLSVIYHKWCTHITTTKNTSFSVGLWDLLLRICAQPDGNGYHQYWSKVTNQVLWYLHGRSSNQMAMATITNQVPCYLHSRSSNQMAMATITNQVPWYLHSKRNNQMAMTTTKTGVK